MDQRRLLRLLPKVIAEVKDDHWMFERQPIEALVAHGEVQAYLHHGFWQAMDTLRDKQQLEELWATVMPHESPGNCSVQPCSYSH
jgi:NDP-sugar pyrophosphorylase family protein